MTPRAATALVFALALTSRLPWLAPTEQDLDGSRFVRALLRFDLAQGHPHPPGYPLFVALGRVAQSLVHDPARALSLVSALSFATVCAITFALSFAATRSRLAAAVAALSFASGTTAAVHSTRPLSDMLGCALAWSTVALSLRPATPRTPWWQGALTGMLAGARPSALPLVAPDLVRLAWRRRALRHAMFAAATVALALYLPVVIATGPARFVALAIDHVSGHFTRFGGSVVTRPDLAERLRAMAFGLQAHALGGWWNDRPWWLLPGSLATWPMLAWGASQLPRTRRWKPIALAALTYGAWAFFGQNVVWQPRHLLPLAPALSLLLSLAVPSLRARGRRVTWAVLLVALAPPSAESLRLLAAQHRVTPAAIALARALPRQHALVATAQLGTWLRWRASTETVVDVRDVDEALALARRTHRRVCVTSEVSGAASRGLTRVAHATGDRYVSPALWDLSLWCTSAP